MPATTNLGPASTNTGNSVTFIGHPRTTAALAGTPSPFDQALPFGTLFYDPSVRPAVYYTATSSAYSAVGSGGTGSAIARTTAQLAGTPSGADIALGAAAQFYDPLQTVDSTHPWVYYSATSTAYVKISGTGGGTPSSTTPNALAATPAIGTSTAFMRADAVLPLPSINAVGGLPQSSGNYNAATNTVLTGPYSGQNLVSGTLPTGGNNAPTGFKVTVAGTPGLDAVGALAVGDELFYSSALVWDVMGGAAQTTGLYKGDGTTSGRLVAAVAGLDYNAGPIFQTAVPFGVMPNCTVGAAGVITYGTTVTTAYPNGAWMWWSAAALYTGSLAGWYWTVLTGTAGAGLGGTVYNNYISTIGASGSASQLAGTASGATIANGLQVPTGLTTAAITGGTHTLTTGTPIYFPGPTMPAGYLGNNGSGEAKYLLRNNNSSTTKSFQAGGNFWQPSNPTTATNTVNTTTFLNAGAQTRQVGEYSDIGSPLDYTASVDTTIAQVLNPKFNIAATNTGNDFCVCEFIRIMLVPRA